MFFLTNISFIVEPGLVVNYLQNLKTSEESLREQVSPFALSFFVICLSKNHNLPSFIYLLILCQLEKAKKKEAAFIVTFAKRDQEVADLKVTLLAISLIYAFKLNTFLF